MDNGKLQALDTPHALTRSLPGSSTLDLTIRYAEDDTTGAVVTALADIPGVERVDQVAMGFDGQPAGSPPGYPRGLGGRVSGGHLPGQYRRPAAKTPAPYVSGSTSPGTPPG